MSDSRPPEFRPFGSRQEASEALACELESLLAATIGEKGAARLVVSGGTSPVELFRSLRGKPLPWSAVTVVPSDEREVPPDHPDRNDAMIRKELLQDRATDARLVSLIPPGSVPDRFDAVVLGMGSDGHTASLFPGSPDLGRTLDSHRTLERLAVPRLGAHRVSLTPRALLSSGDVFLLFFGDEKRVVYEAALRSGDVSEYPVRAILRQDRVPVTVYWAP